MLNETNPSPLPEKPEPTIHKHRHGFKMSWGNLGILFTAFAVIVLLGSYYVADARIIAANTSIAEANDALHTVVEKQAATIQQLQEKLQQASVQWQAQANAINDLRKNETGNQEQWIVAEASYLTTLANDNLKVGTNLPLVISLLQTADQKLQNITDPKVTAIREALTKDLTSLQSVPGVDTTGIYLKLAALNQEVDNLPLPNRRPAEAIALSQTQPNTKWWQRGWQNTVSALKQLVKVRYNSPSDHPFVAPETQDFLFQNLHAKFEIAQAALINRQEKVYQQSLQASADWIKKYFIQDSSVTTSILNQLAELQKIDIQPELPTIDNTLTAFHQYGLASDTTQSKT